MNSSKLLTYGKSGQIKLINKKRLECMNECIKNPTCVSVLTVKSNLNEDNSCNLQTGVNICVYLLFLIFKANYFIRIMLT